MTTEPVNRSHLHDLGPVIPEGSDALDDLTLQELGAIARELKADPYEAVTGWQRWDALARIGRAWERRQTPTAKLDPWVQLSPVELLRLLRMRKEDRVEKDETVAVDPAAAAADPTGSSVESSPPPDSD